MNGTIFSVEEFSTFDGPGIRTTVFLKGCPLRCMWCHNPEGQHVEPEVVRSPNGCISCNACLKAGKEKLGYPSLVMESISACPRHLVRVCGEEITPTQLVERLGKKLWMLNAAGGGVTFSGGEPLSQPGFLRECLQQLESRTHRAIQTSGYCAPEIFADILNHCDYVLYDLKLIDPILHRHYTGVNNQRILQNYQYLANSKKSFITRIPLIPGVNDSEDNLTATAEFLSSLNVKELQLLPYNRAAGAKYKLVGRAYETDFDQNAAPDPHPEVFEKYDIEVSIL